MRRIGVLMGGNENDPVRKSLVSAFTQALADLGWNDRRKVRMDVRWGGGDVDRMRTLAQELVALHPDVIATNGTAATAAVQGDTQTIPIVLRILAIPSASGLVERLDRPSGNITGFATAPCLRPGPNGTRRAVHPRDVLRPPLIPWGRVRTAPTSIGPDATR